MVKNVGTADALGIEGCELALAPGATCEFPNTVQAAAAQAHEERTIRVAFTDARTMQIGEATTLLDVFTGLGVLGYGRLYTPFEARDTTEPRPSLAVTKDVWVANGRTLWALSDPPRQVLFEHWVTLHGKGMTSHKMRWSPL